MSHDVFISYSSKNKQIVDALVHHLEENKIRCWIAPRDIVGGAEYADVIADAIKNSSILVLVYSEHSAVSRFCKQETNLALSSGKIIIPFKIDSSELSGSMEFYLNDKHWIDAFPNPELHFGKIVVAIKRFLPNQIVNDGCGVLQDAALLNSPSKCLRFVEIVFSTVMGSVGLIGCGYVIAAFTHIGNIHNQWHVWMFWVYPVLMPLIVVIGVCLAQQHPVLFARRCLCWKRCDIYFKWRTVLTATLRVLVGWLIGLYGIIFVIVMPICACVKFNAGFVISQKNISQILCLASGCLCWGYLLLKTAWALLDKDWVKFQFSPKRLLRCFSIVAMPFVVALLCMLIFSSSIK